MKFKKIRALRGNSIVIKTNEQFETVIKAELTSGFGVPIGRFQHDSETNSFVLSADSTARLTGTYKYQITVTKGTIVETILYGYISVM